MEPAEPTAPSDRDRFERLRLDAVERLNLLDTPAEERFDRITRIARELFDVPIAEINIIDDRRQYTKSPQPGGVAGDIALDDSFCAVTVQQSDIIVVPDATQDDRFSSRSAVSDERHIRFYAGRPLSIDQQNQVGTLCLVDTTPRAFSDEQRQLLDELGGWVERELQDTADLDRATEVQQKLLPHRQPAQAVPGGFDLAGACVPAMAVAGDFYAWHGEEGEIELTLADVMGKGTAGAILAATVRSAFQSRTGIDVVTAIEQVNEQLIDDLGATGSFATLFHARIDTSTGAIVYADGGHGLTIVVHPDGSYERLEATGLPIGIVSDGLWTRGEAVLARGDRLLTFTDGLLDLFDGSLGSLDPIAALVRAAGSAGGSQRVVDTFTSLVPPRADDDVTLVVVSRG
jgi:sigma-B regulation protein RsbU (phosphoserine phosphatase)